jgi:hypothetical protein
MSEHIDHQTGEVYARMPGAIAQAIIAVKKQVRQIGQDERNEHGKYRYVSVDRFYSIIGPMMAEAGIALLIDETDSEVKEGKSGSPWLFAHYALAFMHEDGSVSAPMRRSLAMPINGPQTYGAAQSYVEKQFLRQVFKIPTGEKDADDTAQADNDRAAPREERDLNPTLDNQERAALEAQYSAEGKDANWRPPRRAPQRQQAAPAPSDAAGEVSKRWKEIAHDIDIEEDKEMLTRLGEWQAFETLDKLSADLGPPEVHAERMGMLQTRAAKRRERLVGSLEPFGVE